MRRAPLALTASTAALLLLVGCTTSSEGDPAVDPGATAEPTAPETLSLEPPECLIGEWTITQEELQVFYDSVRDATDGAVTFVVEGDTGLSFTEADFAYTPDLTLTITTPATAGVATLSGSIAGGYTADTTTVTTANETVDVAYDYIVDGVAQDASVIFGNAVLGAPINGGDYECTPAGPLISFDNGFGRVPVQLVPLR
ncbi:hypothetical protein [Microcella frigidaquae]|uniref:Lipoprotein n=1 Tax=Microcella frigidaquae TaxID=424758 RepID=A0A840X6U6_9MICO|nr:hypothetical protein [Microcella frigidaquae]MBB5618273.1 hypothetical protein [Microcella frigidaquae]NHN45947.1 hypothetical protein [Microcella frigidaquae]